MRKATLYLMMSTMLAVGVLFTAERAGAQVTPVISFNRSLGQLPESIAIDKLGNIYVSFPPIHTVEKVTPDGTASAFAVLPAGAVLGVATKNSDEGEGDSVAADEGANNVFALLNAASAANNGVWRIAPDGTATLFANLPPGGALNALAFDHRGNLFVTDSFKATIFKIDRDGAASVWLTDTSTLGGTPNPTPCGNFPRSGLGANGIAFNKRGDVFVLNTTQGAIVRISTDADGIPGTPEFFVGPTCDLWGADGQAFDNHDNLYVAVNIQNKIVRITPDATFATIASASGGDPLFTPTAIAFETGLGERKEIFITNATFFLPSATPGIVKMDVGVPGLPLP